MNFITIIVSILLSLFSTVVMSYVALATPIGPWIGPTLVFIALLFSRLCISMSTSAIAHAVSAGSIGGILATACAFSFPTLYFLDSLTFNAWMASPLFFCSVVGGFSFFAGMFGLLVADASEKTLIEQQNLSFPIGQLMYKMIAAQNQIKKAYELMAGFCCTALFCSLQGGIFFIKEIVPKSLVVLPAMRYAFFSFPRIVVQLDIAPMVCAIGFVTGHVIALPLAVGGLATIFLLNPLQKLFFVSLSSVEFTLAFCSGIVLFITAMSVISMPHQIVTWLRKSVKRMTDYRRLSLPLFRVSVMVGIGIFMGALCWFLSYFNFPYTTQLYLIVCTIITTYQISAIAGRVGLALLGRFATFVMVPAMLIFNLTYVHLVFIATFVEMSGGVATDILFGRKLAQLAGISQAVIRRYQLLGLVVSSLAIGIVFWLLINHFGLGSPELFAYRAQSRQLLIQAQQFDYTVMIFGALFGLLLKQINLNPMLVLGGLLMPFDITFGLVLGGILALFSRDKEEWYPFWSGVFASNSIVMLLRSVFM
jgi:hypothetical protein